MPMRKRSSPSMTEVIPNPDPLRKHLLELLRMKGAHLGFDEAVASFPVDLRGRKPQGAPHTPWQLLEHLRIAQWDILDFSCNPQYREMKWPDDYRSEEHTSELQSLRHLVCRLLLEKKKTTNYTPILLAISQQNPCVTSLPLCV